jgi:hypothetical protein
MFLLCFGRQVYRMLGFHILSFFFEKLNSKNWAIKIMNLDVLSLYQKTDMNGLRFAFDIFSFVTDMAGKMDRKSVEAEDEARCDEMILTGSVNIQKP